MALKLVSVDLRTQLEQCLDFRRDAHKISHGSEQGFSDKEATAWFRSLASTNSRGFVMVYRESECIGMCEFNARWKLINKRYCAYINLFYIVPAYRGRGFGKGTHELVVQQLRDDGCAEARLRYIPGNDLAENFYLKNGWMKLGEPMERGQLMSLTL